MIAFTLISVLSLCSLLLTFLHLMAIQRSGGPYTDNPGAICSLCNLLFVLALLMGKILPIFDFECPSQILFTSTEIA